ncbi:hypothetical protein Scep_022026 [Stephania cephalantha]|uniref:Uncharacterized protein n=1 Tax=Stephania cephalantha TaxID=152367 RepID=A0AAP0FA40_9MAGN
MDFGLETSIEGHGTYEAIVGCRVRILRRERDVLRTICDFSSAIAWSGPLAIARVRAGRQVSRPEPESAGLLPRLNDLLVGTLCYFASLID